MNVKGELGDCKLINSLTPGLNLEGIDVGLFLPDEGVIDPHSIMMGYASQARSMGVRILEGVEAIGLEIQGERVTGVNTTAGTIAAECVVNAAGARARQVGLWAGMDLPITNLKRHILVTGPVAAYSQTIPFTFEWEKGWYMRREGPGLLIGMGASACKWNDERVDADFVEKIIDYASYRASALEEAGLMTSWAGIRSFSPDEDPILGRAPHLQNFINDCGWNGHGVMHAPAAGMALAELIVHGNTTTLDISHFGFERFRET
jgi:sarcosine oxidase subunit beta